jgi:hypothetical protein
VLVLALGWIGGSPGGGARSAPAPRPGPIVAVFDVEAREVRLPAALTAHLADYAATLLAGPGYRVVPRGFSSGVRCVRQ